MREKPLDVLKEQKARPAVLDNPCDLKKSISSLVIESSPLASDGKRLARKSSDQKVKRRQFFGSDFGNVSIWFVIREMGAVDGDGVGVDLGIPDTLTLLSNS